MRRRLVFTVAVTSWLTLFMGLGYVAAQDTEPPADAEPAGAAAVEDSVPTAEARDASIALAADARGYTELVALWRSRSASLTDGDNERADERLARLIKAADAAGSQRLDAFAIALLREARVAADADRVPQAEKRLEAAEALAPGLPEIHDTRAAVAIGDNPLAVHRWVSHRTRGVLARVDDFQRRLLLFGDLILMGLLVFGAAGVAFVGTQFLRYGLNVFHDLGNAFPSTMRIVLLVAVLLVLALPIIYGFGPALLVFPIAGVLWSYQTRGERVAMAVFVVLLGVSPWLVRMGDRLTEAGTGTSQALHALALNPGDGRALETIESAIAAQPDDWQAHAVLGLAYKRLGALDRAEKALRAAVSTRVEDQEAEGTILNNLGNVLFAQGRGRSAEEAYQKAQRRVRTAAEPAFNLHRLYRRQGRLDDAEKAIQTASGLDAQSVAAWSQDDEATANRYVVDMPLPTTTLTRRAMSDLFSDTPVARRVWIVVAGPVPEMTAPLAALVTLIIFGLLTPVRPRMRLTWPCVRCARPAPTLMRNGPPDHPQCEQCVNLFVKNIPVDRRVRFQKEQAVARYGTIRRWATRGMGLLLPGTVDLLRGSAVRGLLVAGLSLLLAAWLVWPDGLLLEPVPELSPSDGMSIGQGLLAAILAALWIGHLVRALRWKERI